MTECEVGTSVVPVPGSGNITRVLDYVESFEQGNEGETINPYAAIVEGPDRNQ